MLEIQPGVVEAFRQRAAAAERAGFDRWLAAYRDKLGIVDTSQADGLLEIAKGWATDLGIDTNAANRIWILAVASRILGELSGEEFLLLGDIVFDSSDDLVRIDAIMRLQQRRQVA